jgi:hypothetical protein
MNRDKQPLTAWQVLLCAFLTLFGLVMLLPAPVPEELSRYVLGIPAVLAALAVLLGR